MQRAFTLDEFCLFYRIGRTRAYEEINAGRLKTVKNGAKTIVRADDAETWLANLTLPESNPPHHVPPGDPHRAAA